MQAKNILKFTHWWIHLTARSSTVTSSEANHSISDPGERVEMILLGSMLAYKYSDYFGVQKLLGIITVYLCLQQTGLGSQCMTLKHKHLLLQRQTSHQEL